VGARHRSPSRSEPDSDEIGPSPGLPGEGPFLIVTVTVPPEGFQADGTVIQSIKLHEKELLVVHAARDEAGPDVELMLDANCASTVDQVRAKRRNCRQSA
jgi:L-alanine-DL-glutamate epimerase-like enolase superfamily enzyme